MWQIQKKNEKRRKKCRRKRCSSVCHMQNVLYYISGQLSIVSHRAAKWPWMTLIRSDLRHCPLTTNAIAIVFVYVCSFHYISNDEQLHSRCIYSYIFYSAPFNNVKRCRSVHGCLSIIPFDTRKCAQYPINILCTNCNATKKRRKQNI